MARKILIVDDEYSFAEFAKMLLDSLGYETLIALDVPGALAVAVEQKPDLILMDVILPGVDGIEAFQRLKANPATAKIPVIFCSISHAPDKIAEAHALGQGFLRKPLKALPLQGLI